MQRSKVYCLDGFQRVSKKKMPSRAATIVMFVFGIIAFMLLMLSWPLLNVLIEKTRKKWRERRAEGSRAEGSSTG